MFTTEVNSVAHSDPIPFTGKFVNPDEAKAQIEFTLRGLSSYWQAWVLNSDGQRVVRGYRSGPNGTGEHWTWEVIRGDPPTR